MYCNNCGKPNPDNSNYCNSCGDRLQLLDNLSDGTVAVAHEETIQKKTRINSKGSFKLIIPWVVFVIFAIKLTTTATGSYGYNYGSFAASIGLRTTNPSIYGYTYPTNYIGYFVYMGLGFIIALIVYRTMKSRKN